MDSHFQLSSVYESDYHETMAHVPSIMLNQIGRKILVIGGGDGLLVRELLRYGTAIDEITLIDIDPEILKLARHNPGLRRLNGDALSDPKVTVITGDAFQAVRRGRGMYDKIYVDVLFPFDFETARLFTVEFFGALGKHLSPGGHLTVLSPIELGDMDEPADQRLLQVMASTLRQAGFPDLHLFGESKHTFMLALRSPPTTDMAANRAGSDLRRYLRDPSNLDRYLHVQVPTTVALVNSVLRPTFFGLHDPNF